MPERIFIGVAWPYANYEIHLGHLVGTFLPADIFARYNRMRGREVLMVSGSDEHGTPITLEAEKRGMEPQELVDLYHGIIKRNLERLGISLDLYFRTSDPNHKRVVQEFFLKLLENGWLYEKDVEQAFCPKCRRFLPDRYVVGRCPFCGYPEAKGDQCPRCGRLLEPQLLEDPRCALDGTPVEFRKTRHFYFKLSKLEDRLREWFFSKDVWRPNVLRYTENYFKEGLRDRAITRDIEWGVPVPIAGYESKRIYVWFDAVIGYLSASMEWARSRGEPERWRDFWQDPEAKHYYFIGKDNVPFHTIIWPGMLMAHGGLNLPYDVPANEFLMMGKRRFSKSAGVGVWLTELLDHFHPDYIRYYGTLVIPEGKDSSFSWADFVNVVNRNLINGYGNLVHRVLTFVHRHFGRSPEPGELDEADREMLRKLEEVHGRMTELLERVLPREAFKHWEWLVGEANAYFNAKAPWAQVKEDPRAAGTTMHVLLTVVKGLSIMGLPYIPFGTSAVLRHLGIDPAGVSWDQALEPFPAGVEIPEPTPLYKRIEVPTPPEDFAILDLRVGQVTHVEPIPGAEKLYQLVVDAGEKFKVVAGLKGIYEPEELMNRLVVIIANIQKAKFMGRYSEAMLLAAEEPVSLLMPEKPVNPGLPVKGSKFTSSPLPGRRVKLSTFRKMRMEVVTIKSGGVVGSRGFEPVRDFEIPEEWVGRKGVAFFSQRGPLILNVEDRILIVPDREVEDGTPIV